MFEEYSLLNWDEVVEAIRNGSETINGYCETDTHMVRDENGFYIDLKFFAEGGEIEDCEIVLRPIISAGLAEQIAQALVL